MLSTTTAALILSPPLPLHSPNRHNRQRFLSHLSPLDHQLRRPLLLPRRPAAAMLPVDPWAPGMNSQGLASQLFAFPLFPYLGFLYFITRSNTAPKFTLFGFYFLLAFVGATIPAGIYGNILVPNKWASAAMFFGANFALCLSSCVAKVQYGTSLSNVDWLHGGAESLLTLTNLFIVLGLMGVLRKLKESKKDDAEISSIVEEKERSSI